MKKDKFDVINAAEKMDWQQVIFNGGPPCFHMDAANGGFCGRAERWPGHGRSGMIHKFVSLANLFRNSKTEIYLTIDMESGNIHRRLKPETVAALPYSYSVENLQPIIFCQRRVFSRFLPVNQSFSPFYQAHWTPVKHRLDPFTGTQDFSTQIPGGVIARPLEYEQGSTGQAHSTGRGKAEQSQTLCGRAHAVPNGGPCSPQRGP